MLPVDLMEAGASQGREEYFMETHLFSHACDPGHTGLGVWPITIYSRGSISYIQDLEAGSSLCSESDLTKT